jgi:hypothetical protein
MKTFITVTLISCLVLLYSSPAIHSMSVEPVTPEQVLANAELILAGTITNIQTRWSGQGESMIATDYTVTLDNVIYDPDELFGPKSDGETIVLSFAGGAIGEKRVAIPGIPSYEVGEQVVFFVDGDWAQGISPLVGTTAGYYRVSNQAGLEGKMTNFAGEPVTRSFYASGDDAPGGFTLVDFIAEIERALPLAKADEDLIITNDVEIPDDIRHLVFTGDEIPKGQPVVGTFLEPSEDIVSLLKDDAIPESPPAFKENHVPEASDNESEGQMFFFNPHFSFLWGPPDATSNFNVPPIYYSGTEWGPNFEYSLSDWNRYADLFRKFASSDNTFGHQGRNDFAFTDWTTFQSVYGFSLPSTVLAIAVMYNSAGNSINTGEKIYESDIILNVDKNWTLDWDVGYSNCNVWYFRTKVLHQAGHCFGREHQFTADPDAMYHSVMNYPPCGALDTEFWLPFVDDPQSIRSAYPSRIHELNDLGVELFRTAGGGTGSGIPVVWSTFDATVKPGQAFSINNFIIENLGTVADTPVIAWYLCPEQQTYSGCYYLMTTTHSPLGPFAYWNTSRMLTVPEAVPIDDYYIAAAIASDDFDWNRSCWTNTRIRVTCCTGFTGNVDGDDGELVDIGDLTALISFLYIPPNPEPLCIQEANIDGDSGGLVDIGDLTALISYLYIPPNPEPAPCQ